MNNITYGVFVLTTKTNRHNGCIINTLVQVTNNPNQISITINKDNYTTKMIKESGSFNVSILDSTTTFDLIKRFGFSSGENQDKFEGFTCYKLSSNGIRYITQSTNAYISAKVTNVVDLGTHVTIFAQVTETGTITDRESLTYADYHKRVKPKLEVKKGVYVCRICGFVHEGDNLPADFVCPICKHGAMDFEFRTPVQELVIKKKFYCPNCDRIEESDMPNLKCSVCGSEMMEIETD